MRKLDRVVLTFILVLGALAASALHAQPLSNTLTTEQVACNELQLEQLLQRLTLERADQGNRTRSLTLLVTYSNEFGFYEGLAVSNQVPLRANAPLGAAGTEHFLAFHINPSIRTLLLNPERQPLAQVSLVREETSSNLVAGNSANAMSLSLNPTLGAQGNAGRLRINNFEVGAGQACGNLRSVDVKPGRGLILAGLVTPCHTELTDFDRMVFAILERTLRVQVTGQPTADTKVAIFRGEEPLTYRINVYPLSNNGQMQGMVALELTLTADAQGRITGGQLQFLPSCSGFLPDECSTSDVALQVFLVPPVFGGNQTRLSSGPAFSVTYQVGATPTPVAVDFDALLGGTTWNQGVGTAQ